MKAQQGPPALFIALVFIIGGLMPAPRLAQAAALSTLTIGVLGLPATLNPLLDGTSMARDVTNALFESLLTTDTHDALQPALAQSYTISKNGLTYTFSLDPRARWQDDVPVTAEDVLFTAKLMRDPQFPAYNRYGFGQIATLSADGPLTVTATLHAPYAPFLRAFSTTPILPSHVLKPIPTASLAQYDAFNRRPIGDGPYAVGDWVTGSQLTLVANSAYYRGTPHIEQIQFKQEASIAAALADLQSGVVGLLGPSIGLDPRQVLATIQSGRFSAFASPGFGWTHIDLIESGFLRDHLVRQSLTLATPRERIVSTLLNGLASPADADQPPTSQYYEPAIAGSLAYDPSRIPAILRSRGFKKLHGVWQKFGRTLSLNLWTDLTCTDCVATARLVAASWTQAGMPTALKLIARHKLFGLHGPLYSANRLFDSNLNAVLYTWTTSPEPDDSFYWQTSLIVRPGHLSGGNFDGYSNPAVDRLTVKALNTTSEGDRITIYRQIQRLLVNDQPDIFLYWTAHLTVAVNGLRGYQANPYVPGVTWNASNWSLR